MLLGGWAGFTHNNKNNCGEQLSETRVSLQKTENRWHVAPYHGLFIHYTTPPPHAEKQDWDDVSDHAEPMTLEDMLRNAPFLPFGKPRNQIGVGRLL